MVTDINSNPNPHPHESDIISLQQRFSELTNHVEFLMFQGEWRWLSWLNTPPNPLSKWQRRFFSITNSQILYFWIIIALFQSIILLIVLERLQGQVEVPPTTAPQDTLERIWAIILQGIFIFLFLTSVFHTYIRWFTLLVRSKRHQLPTWLIFFGLTAGISVGSIYLTKVYIAPSLGSIKPWILILLLIVFPSVTFFLVGVLDLLRWLLVLLKKGFYLHEPHPNDVIKRLLTTPINSTEGNQSATGNRDHASWQLAELNGREIQLFRDWARINQENTEKRLIPTAIIFATFGVLIDAVANTEIFTSFVEGSIRGAIGLIVQTPSTPQNFIGIFLFGMISSVVLIPIFVFWRLFRNLVVQGVILESLLLVEYLKPEEHSHMPQGSLEVKNNRVGWLKRFLNNLFS